MSVDDVTQAQVSRDFAADVVRDKGVLYARILVSIGVTILRSLFLVRWLSALEIGAYRLATSWVGYFGLLSLGTVETYYIKAPGLLKAGRDDDARSLRGVALSMSIAAACVTGLGIGTLAFTTGLGGVVTSLAFGLNGSLLALTPYLTISHLVSAEFSRQAWREMAGTVTAAVLGLGGLVLAGLNGLLIGTAAGLGLTVWLARDRFSRPTWTWPAWTSVSESVGFGSGQSAYLFMQGLVFAIDLQVLAVLWRANEQFAVYAFGTLLIAAIRTAATAGAVVEQTRLLELHGHPGREDAGALLQEADRQRRLDNVVVSIVSLLGLAGVIVAAPIAFPRFAGIVEVMGAFTISIMSTRIGFFHTVTLSMKRGQFVGILAAVIGTAANAAWCCVSVLLQWPMQAVALAPAVGGFICSVLTVMACDWTLIGRTAWRTVPRLFLPLLPLLPLLALSAGRFWYLNLAVVTLTALLYLLQTRRVDPGSLNTATSLLKCLLVAPARPMGSMGHPRRRREP